MNTNSIFFYSFILCLFFSCRKHDTLPPITESFNLEINQRGNWLEYKWDKVDLSIFESYYIFQSKKPIPTNLDSLLENLNGSIGIGLTASIDKSDSTSYNEIIHTRDSILYFRAFIKTSERYIASNQVQIEFSAHPIFLSYTDFFHAKEFGILYYSKGAGVGIYDVDSKDFLNSNSEIGLSQKVSIFSHGIYNDGEEIYLSNDVDKKIIVLDANSLDVKKEISIGDCTIKHLAYDGNELIYIIKNCVDGDKLAVLRRDSGIELSSINCNMNSPYPNSSTSNFALLENNEVMVLNQTGDHFGEINRFRFFQNSFEATEPIIEFQSPPNSSSDIVSPSKEFFIPNRKGTIFSNNWEIYSNLSIQEDSQNYNRYFTFSKDGEQIFVQDIEVSDSWDFFNFIDLYSFPSMEKVTRIDTNFKTYKDIFSDDNKLILIYEREGFGFDQDTRMIEIEY